MPAITIQLPDELFELLARAVELTHQDTHDFILQAIAERTANLSTDDALDAEVEASYAEYFRSGESVSIEEARRHFDRRLAGDHDDKFVFEKSKPKT